MISNGFPMESILLALSLVLLVLLIWLLLESIQAHHRLEAAINTLNLQVAFVAGRVGLTRRDLAQAEEVRREGTPAVEGDAVWDDIQERLDLLTEQQEADAAKGHAVVQD